MGYYDKHRTSNKLTDEAELDDFLTGLTVEGSDIQWIAEEGVFPAVLRRLDVKVMKPDSSGNLRHVLAFTWEREKDSHRAIHDVWAIGKKVSWKAGAYGFTNPRVSGRIDELIRKWRVSTPPMRGDIHVGVRTNEAGKSFLVIEKVTIDPDLLLGWLGLTPDSPAPASAAKPAAPSAQAKPAPAKPADKAVDPDLAPGDPAELDNLE